MKVVYCLDNISDSCFKFLSASIYSVIKNTNLEPIILGSNKNDFLKHKEFFQKYNVKFIHQNSYIYNSILLKYDRKFIVDIFKDCKKLNFGYYFNNGVYLKIEVPKYFDDDEIIVADIDTIFTSYFNTDELKGIEYIGAVNDCFNKKDNDIINGGFIYYNIKNCKKNIENILDKAINIILDNIKKDDIYYYDLLEEKTITDIYKNKITIIGDEYNFRPQNIIPSGMNVKVFHHQGIGKYCENQDNTILYENSKLIRQYFAELKKLEGGVIDSQQKIDKEFNYNFDYTYSSELAEKSILNTTLAENYLNIQSDKISLPTCPKPLISVVVRVFNEHYEWRMNAVKSVLTQENVSVEVLLIHDCTTNDYWPIDDYRVGHIYLSENHGPGYLRKLGNKLARGKYVKILDADDELLPNSLKLQSDVMEKDINIKIVFGMIEPFGEFAQYNSETDIVKCSTLSNVWDNNKETLKNILLKYNYPIVPAPTAMWRRDWTLEYDFPLDFDYAEDNAWCMGLMAMDKNSDCAYFIYKKVLKYNMRNNSMTGFNTSEISVIKRDIMSNRFNIAKRYSRFEEIKNKNNVPKKIAIVDKYGLLIGGSHWSIMQTMIHIDKSMVTPRFFVSKPIQQNDKLMREHGIFVEYPDDPINYHEWLPIALKKWNPDAIDTIWDCTAINSDIAKLAPQIFCHLQSTALEYSGIYEENRINIINKFTCVSESVYDLINEIPDNRKNIIYSPVDSVLIHSKKKYRNIIRKSLGISPHEKVVFWSGRILDNFKRFDILKHLVVKYHNDVRFIVAGTTQYSSNNEIKHKAEIQSWADRYNVLWFDELQPWHTSSLAVASDIYLSTSNVEGLSLALLEAMAAGLYCVVTDCGGTRTAINNDLTGKICKIGNVFDIENNFKYAISLNMTEIKELGYINYNIVKGKFDVRENARKHVLLYYGEKI
jgi:glycosyltransferase involved in cell wall biosynthesis